MFWSRKISMDQLKEFADHKWFVLATIFWLRIPSRRFFCLDHKWAVDDFYDWTLPTILTFKPSDTFQFDLPIYLDQSFE